MNVQALYPQARILMVDDQPANLRLLECILAHGGYTRYRSITDSRQALAVAEEFQPDLLLIDLMMPHLDGVAVLTQLRLLQEGDYLPALVLTADVTPDAKQRVLAAGAKDFLTKPVDAVEVLLRLQNLLETRFLYKQLREQSDRRIQAQSVLLDCTNDAILVVDADDRIRFWNRGAERLYGWTDAEAVGQEFRTLLQTTVSDMEQTRRELDRSGTCEGMVRQVTRDGRTVIVASRWSLGRDAGGQASFRLVINTDVTEKSQLQAELLAAGILPGDSVQEFQGALTTLLRHAESVQRSIPDEHPARESMQLICKAARQLEALASPLVAAQPLRDREPREATNVA